MRSVIGLIILWGLVLSAGCQANPAEASLPLEINSSPVAEFFSTSVPVSPTQGDVAMTPSMSVDAGLQNLIDKAIADLAQRLSIPVPEIKLMEVRKVVWPDASLGCPQPGIKYAQVQVDGLLFRLGVGKQMYLYHSGAGKDPFLCESASPVIPNVTPKTDEFVPPPDSEID